MPFERSEEWWRARIDMEPDGPIGAGRLAEACEDSASASMEASARASFGELIHLLRRREGLSVKEFAETVNIDLSEAQAIEEDPYYKVEARTVWYIARKYNFPQAELNALAGVVVANDAEPHAVQERFAARSQLLGKLSANETALFDAVVSVIQDHADRVQA